MILGEDGAIKHVRTRCKLKEDYTNLEEAVKVTGYFYLTHAHCYLAVEQVEDLALRSDPSRAKGHRRLLLPRRHQKQTHLCQIPIK